MSAKTRSCDHHDHERDGVRVYAAMILMWVPGPPPGPTYEPDGYDDGIWLCKSHAEQFIAWLSGNGAFHSAHWERKMIGENTQALDRIDVLQRQRHSSLIERIFRFIIYGEKV